MLTIFHDKILFILSKKNSSRIRLGREDVLMLYLLEYDSLLPSKLDELDNKGEVALDLSLKLSRNAIAKTLVKYGANVNRKTIDGYSLLHKAIFRSDKDSASFLIDNNAETNGRLKNGNTPLHQVAALSLEMADLAVQLLKHNADPNSQNEDGDTPLHLAVRSKNNAVLDILLQIGEKLDLDITNSTEMTPLRISLTFDHTYESSMAGKLLKSGASSDTTHGPGI